MDAKTPKEGDIIEFSRGGYYHYAVYTGEGEVVHLTTGSSLASSTVSVGSIHSEVRKDKLQDVAGGDDWKVNNIQDDKLEPRNTQETVGTALSLVGKERPYNLVTSNCEHLATDLRYGKAESAQVEDVKKIVSEVGMIGAAAVALASVVSHAKSPQSHSP